MLLILNRNWEIAATAGKSTFQANIRNHKILRRNKQNLGKGLTEKVSTIGANIQN
jgi:hypothetical protein